MATAKRNRKNKGPTADEQIAAEFRYRQLVAELYKYTPPLPPPTNSIDGVEMVGPLTKYEAFHLFIAISRLVNGWDNNNLPKPANDENIELIWDRMDRALNDIQTWRHMMETVGDRRSNLVSLRDYRDRKSPSAPEAG